MYPKSPEKLPDNFVKFTSAYMFKSLLAILAIVLFFVLYVAMVVGIGYLVYYSVIYDMGSINKLTIILKIGAIGGSAMLFVFTLKFIFKIKNFKPENRIKLDKDEQNELWSFVNKICEETGAPKAKNIYLDPDVNAYVAYSNTWLSLFLPIRKELTIGMGLIDTFNLTEFKAVISHEFGHFAQRSMKIGSYINSANTIIFGMIYDRDKFDEILEQWKEADIRLSVAAWAITPVIWGIRQILALFYQFLNLMYSLLSREMEFNADKVAVSTSGSEAIVSALWKLDDGFECWSTIMNHAYLAEKKKIHVENLYEHNQLAHGRIQDKQQEKRNKLAVDDLGNTQFFPTSENSKVSMYASHPANDLREQNAKMPFVACEEDTRSPWILFSNVEALQKEMTLLVYKQYLNKEVKDFATVPTFEKFIEQEAKGKELAEEYQDTFVNRFLFIDDEKRLVLKAKEQDEITKKQLEILKEELIPLMKPVKELDSLMLKAVAISEGTTKEVVLDYKGKSFKKKNLQEAYQQLYKDREQLFNEDFKDWDTKFCYLHLGLAYKVNKNEDLLKLYKQHNVIIQIYRAIINTKEIIYKDLELLQQKVEVTQIEVDTFASKVKTWFEDLNEVLANMDKITFVPLTNIDTVEEFKEAIVEGGEFKIEAGKIFENGGFDKMMHSIENATNHCQRLEQKSIGTILMFHKSLENELQKDLVENA